MKLKIYILAFLICNVFFANANSKNTRPLVTISYPTPACIIPGNLLDVTKIDNNIIIIDPDNTDPSPIEGIYSSTAGLVIDPDTGQIDAGASTAGTYVVRFTFIGIIGFAQTTVKISEVVLPTFNPIGTVCKGGVAPVLPTISTNGISGSWSPSVINTTAFGSSTYYFYPSFGQCGDPTSITVTITTALVVPTFNPIATTYCVNEVAPTLPTKSTNGIVGTWVPSVISTSTIGTNNYVFTPNSGECITSPVISITINAPIMPDFQDINLTTSYQVVPVLSTTSPNGISGTWNPSSIDRTITADYTFTPYSGLCGTQKTITVTRSYPIANIPPPLQTCNNGGGFGSFDLIDNSSVINTNSGFYTVDYFPTLALAQSTSPIGSLPVINYTNTTPFNQTIYARVTNQTSFNYYHSVVPVQLVVNPSAIQPVISSLNNEYNVYLDANNNVIQPLTLSTVFNGNNITCIWTRDDQAVAVSPNTSFVINTFTGLNVPKSYKVTVINNNNPGCNGTSNTIIINQIRVPTPTGNATQNYIAGQTLANLIVTGSNIRWYSSPIQSPATLLPLTTPLVNGTTYYATQTIGGAESPGVFGVTATLGTLAREDFKFIDLKYSPNPVIDVLSIQSQESIKNISIFNILGQEVYTRKYNDSEIKLDLSNLISGNYFAKIESENKKQIFKIIKK